MPHRVIMHIDLDSFYAQCEENADPRIQGKPVVVCVYSGRTEDSGAVSTANYKARKYGVRAGIPIVQAKKLLETIDAAFLPMNHPRYEEVSERIMEILRAQGEVMEQTSIDEAFLDVTYRTSRDFNAARTAAVEIKEQLTKQEAVTCSIGIGPNKLLAKIASDHSKPNGLTIVKPEQVAEFLSPLPCNRIPGVGKKAEEKLTQLRISTVEELTKLSPNILLENFGKSLGNYLYLAARGEDEDPVKERGQPTQFSRIATLKHNTREPEETFALLIELSRSIAEKLREQRVTCKNVTTIAILTDLSIHSRSKSLEAPTSNSDQLEVAAKQLIREFLCTNPQAVLRRVGVKVSGLTESGGQTDMSKFLTA